ncbi:MAG: hypothetical protein LBK95_19970 [Bifidobacteriaceae bacterium]|nr:hypothetical protein [Bifidobacteriaceae bacterium]
MIDERKLTIGSKIGSGGAGDSFLLDRPLRPDLPAEMVYKRWREGTGPTGAAQVAALVGFRDRLDSEDRAYLDEVAAWPREMVAAAGRVAGYLMPCAPAEFMHRNPAFGPQCSSVKLLFAKARRGRSAGAEVPDDSDVVSRLVIVAKLAHALRWLHSKGCVFGDLSHENELYAVQGQPRIYLIDTDEIALPGNRVPQHETPGYRAPEAAQLGHFSSQQADVYKFTLVLVRVLSPPREQLSQTASPDFVSGVLDADGVGLVARGLATDPATRPSMTEFYDYLYRFVGAQLGTPPVVTSVTLDRGFAVAGEQVTVTVRSDGASTVAVTPPGCAASEGLVGNPVSVSFDARSSGPVLVRAVNQNGVAAAVSEPLHVLPPVRAPSVARMDARRPDAVCVNWSEAAFAAGSGWQELPDAVRLGPVGASAAFVADLPARNYSGPLFSSGLMPVLNCYWKGN